MIPQPCRANDILRAQLAKMQKSRMPGDDAQQLIHWAEAFRMLLEIDSADFAYWERIARATENQRRTFLRAESQHKYVGRAA